MFLGSMTSQLHLYPSLKRASITASFLGVFLEIGRGFSWVAWLYHEADGELLASQYLKLFSWALFRAGFAIPLYC